GSFFPPRDLTHEDIVHVYDKDLCRILPLQFQSMTEKDGIKAGLYTPPDDVFELPDKQPDNKCFCPGQECQCPPRGLQNISPCQFDETTSIIFGDSVAVVSRQGRQEKHCSPLIEDIFRRGEKGKSCGCQVKMQAAELRIILPERLTLFVLDAPVYLSFPHFYKADPSLVEAFEGLKPIKEKHETYFKIQPKLGVPVEGKVKVQLNLKVEHTMNIFSVAKFPDIVFPIIWLEELLPAASLALM
ncbi:unnamed protein product, partial [Timema podura]|nr:unnamed protein product [Timema podura]